MFDFLKGEVLLFYVLLDRIEQQWTVFKPTDAASQFHSGLDFLSSLYVPHSENHCLFHLTNLIQSLWSHEFSQKSPLHEFLVAAASLWCI